MRVTTKGQVTSPQNIRDKLGITPATEVDFIEEKGRIFLVKQSPLPDFHIGAQAAVLGMDLITRDEGRCRTCFPTVRIMCPEQ